MIKAITFDFWGTLFKDAFGKERQEYRAKAISNILRGAVSLEEAKEALSIAAKEFARCHIEEQRTLNPEDAVDIVSLHLGVEFSKSQFDFLVEEFATAILVYQPEPIEGAIDAVKLAYENFPVALISDTGISPGRSLQKLLDEYEFSQYFSFCCYSDEVGVSKPRPIMFELTAEKLNVRPENILHIGDLEPTDIKGIKEVGGYGGLFVGVNDKYRNDTRADFIFQSWYEFIERFSEIESFVSGR
ncbi:MAG: HAD family hydrolase [Candidatus Hydrogenedentes bacterium]|nr:HAD family hydrolase [Candidatus Hydrogenedentota bacterium]